LHVACKAKDSLKGAANNTYNGNGAERALGVLCFSSFMAAIDRHYTATARGRAVAVPG
jgi:hypothetical protein